MKGRYSMGERKAVDKTVKVEDVLRALQAGTVTLAAAQAMFNGVFNLGDYKGYACIVDLDLLVKQPLVFAEQQHILGLLDGREEDYDHQLVTIPAGTGVNASVSENLTVPAGEVWYVTAVVTFTPADNPGVPAINWHCSLWTDRAAVPSVFGQPYHNVPLSNAGPGATYWDEFNSIAPVIGGPAPGAVPTNKPFPLRLPAGTVITFVATNLGAGVAGAGGMICTGALYGYIGKSLVD